MRPTSENHRQHKRHKLENSVAVSSHGIYQVIDISMGGFRLKCPPHTPVPDSWDTDILASATSLEGFPAKRVWVSTFDNATLAYFPMVVGVKFGRLTKKQDAHLSQFIASISQGDDSAH